MVDTDDFEKMLDEAEGIDPKDRAASFARRLARMSDHQFSIYSKTVCAAGDQHKREQAAQPAPDTRTAEERALDKLSDGEFRDYMKSRGVNLDSSFGETISDRVYRDKKRHVE